MIQNENGFGFHNGFVSDCGIETHPEYEIKLVKEPGSSGYQVRCNFTNDNGIWFVLNFRTNSKTKLESILKTIPNLILNMF